MRANARRFGSLNCSSAMRRLGQSQAAATPPQCSLCRRPSRGSGRASVRPDRTQHRERSDDPSNRPGNRCLDVTSLTSAGGKLASIRSTEPAARMGGRREPVTQCREIRRRSASGRRCPEVGRHQQWSRAFLFGPWRRGARGKVEPQDGSGAPGGQHEHVEALGRGQRLLLQGVEGGLLSREHQARGHARLVRRAAAHGGDQQHLLPDAQGRGAAALGEATPEAFRFAIKASRRITHDARLKADAAADRGLPLQEPGHARAPSAGRCCSSCRRS